MKKTRARSVVVWALAIPLGASTLGLAAVPDGLPGTAEVVRRVVVPSTERPQGEVQVVRAMDGQVAVRTVLLSKVLRRVAGSIAEKEERNWGSESASRRYIEALDDVVRRLRADAQVERAAGDDRRQGLCIDFSVDGGTGRVVVSAADVEADGDRFGLRTTRAPEIRLELPIEYTARNMVLIIADAFSVDEEQARGMLSEAARGSED